MSQKTGLRALFVSMAIVLVSTFIATYVMGLFVLAARDEMGRQRRVMVATEDILSTMKDAETGQRGFLLTNNASYLEPYTQAVQHIQAEVSELHRLAQTEGAIPDSTVDRLENLITRKFEELKRSIDARQAGNAEAALAMINSNTGKQLMDSIRELGNLIDNQNDSARLAAQANADRLTWWRTAVFAMAVMTNLAFISWTYYRLSNEMQRRMDANLEVARQRDLLAVTLASIGDAVIVTDSDAKVTFMNSVAQKLTGWTQDEARGMPCTTVFKIINEDSRLPVESPVDRVLREGVVVGLANHTLLINRDKTETPIDDSGAPIREPNGMIRGVVLIFRDFTEHKESERRLRDANTSLEAANRAKDQFLAALSHELRTPLTPVLATLTMWAASDELPAAIMPDVHMLRRNVELEARLIDDLLDLTRIVKGKMAINLEVVDVHHLIHETADMYASEIRTKRLDLDLALKASCHQVTADPARLQQVFWNLLKNSTKFTPSGGQLRVVTENNPDGRLEVRFSDTGIGIEKETISRLFKPFEQGSQDISRKYGGLGLGLALSKAIVEAQGGQISVESEGMNKGSTFTVELPALSNTTMAPPRRTTTETLSRESREPSRRLKILIVEDHLDTATALGHLLRSMGHTVELRNTVVDALDALRDPQLDLLISDLGLPDGTGIDLMRQARAYFSQPAIALTGFGMEEDIARCKDAGFTVHLTKPVNFQKLSNVIRQVAIK